MMELTDSELRVLVERIDRCKSCLIRWVDNSHITENVVCLLTIKIICDNIKDLSPEAENKTLFILFDCLKEYINKEFERKRKIKKGGD